MNRPHEESDKTMGRSTSKTTMHTAKGVAPKATTKMTRSGAKASVRHERDGGARGVQSGSQRFR